ncbi:MAG TPA: DUF1573 domain-containing protein [Thermoanaerobaculia bacterium]|jgi:hypothetical protein|nr:DUF1573 domain-containing protein [Thermoanaerobaculia bacterium]
MSDDFGTVSVKRGDRAREIEVLRQHYRTHRETLVRMVPDAPTEQLAGEYQRLVASIDGSLRKLDELEGKGTASGTVAVPSPSFNETQRMGTAPGNRPLVPQGGSSEPVTDHGIANYDVPTDRPSNNGSRMLLMMLIAVAVLGVIGWLIWRASSDKKTTTPQVIEQPPSTTSPDTTATVAPVAATASIRIAPEVADYGTIRKGTRAVRQFEITNTSSTPLSITVARSTCRCLYYEYDTKAKLAPKAKEALTVTVDGARAKAGALNERIAVSSKDDPNATGTIGVRAVIK